MRVLYAYVLVVSFLSSCAPSIVDEGPSDYSLSADPVNVDVGHHIIHHVRDRLQERFCSNSRFGITILDVGSTAPEKSQLPSQAMRNDLVISWLFESKRKMAEDPSITHGERLKYFTRPKSDNYILAHEIGHHWLTQYSKLPTITKGEYGTSAVDWLDEAIAIQFESDAKKEARRNRFLEAFHYGDIFELDAFLNAPHPIHFPNHDYTFYSQLDGKSKVRKATPVDHDVFYGQALAFSEYIIAKSGDACFLAQLVTELERSNNIVEGLHNTGIMESETGQYRLQTDFFSWLASGTSFRGRAH